MAEMLRESLYERRAAGVFVFRTGLVLLPLWALASLYLYMRVEQNGSALFGIVPMLLIPVVTLAIGFSFYVSGARQLRRAYGESSTGLLRRQPRHVAAMEDLQGGSMEDILRRMERDLGN
jgi:hypothetical protein